MIDLCIMRDHAKVPTSSSWFWGLREAPCCRQVCFDAQETAMAMTKARELNLKPLNPHP